MRAFRPRETKFNNFAWLCVQLEYHLVWILIFHHAIDTRKFFYKYRYTLLSLCTEYRKCLIDDDGHNYGGGDLYEKII